MAASLTTSRSPGRSAPAGPVRARRASDRRAGRAAAGARRGAVRGARSRRAWVTSPPTPRPRRARRWRRRRRPARAARCARPRRRDPQRRAVGVGDGVGVHLRVHLARVDGHDAHAGALELRAQDAPEVIERRLRHAVRAPRRVGRHRRVRRDVDDHAPPAQRHRPARSFVRRNGPTRFTCERLLERLALGVEQGPQRHVAQRARVLHEEVDRPDQRRRGAGDRVRRPLVADVRRRSRAPRRPRPGCPRRRARARRPRAPRARRARPPPPARCASAAPSPRLAPVTSAVALEAPCACLLNVMHAAHRSRPLAFLPIHWHRSKLWAWTTEVAGRLAANIAAAPRGARADPAADGEARRRAARDVGAPRERAGEPDARGAQPGRGRAPGHASRS